MKIQFRFALALGLALLLISCEIKNALRFNVTVNNVGDLDLDDVKVQFQDFYDHAGILSHKTFSIYSYYAGKIPKEATISWRFQGERPYMPDHVVTVAIPVERQKFGSATEYELRFDLDGETVKPRWIVNN